MFHAAVTKKIRYIDRIIFFGTCIKCVKRSENNTYLIFYEARLARRIHKCSLIVNEANGRKSVCQMIVSYCNRDTCGKISCTQECVKRSSAAFLQGEDRFKISHFLDCNAVDLKDTRLTDITTHTHMHTTGVFTAQTDRKLDENFPSTFLLYEFQIPKERIY